MPGYAASHAIPTKLRIFKVRKPASIKRPRANSTAWPASRRTSRWAVRHTIETADTVYENNMGDREFEEPGPPVIYGPPEQQRRQAWQFKRRHIELMTLGSLNYS
jgi:hypothetical protein